MKHREIWIGCDYVVSSAYGRGRARVTGPGQRTRHSHEYRFPVLFPDAPPARSGRMEKNEDMVPSSKFQRPWTDEDDERYGEIRRIRAEVDAMEMGLRAAGFAPDEVRYISAGDLYLSFRGDIAESVIETLIASAKDETPKVGSGKKELPAPVQ